MSERNAVSTLWTVPFLVGAGLEAYGNISGVAGAERLGIIPLSLYAAMCLVAGLCAFSDTAKEAYLKVGRLPRWKRAYSWFVTLVLLGVSAWFGHMVIAFLIAFGAGLAATGRHAALSEIDS
jgi:hypothetical protein